MPIINKTIKLLIDAFIHSWNNFSDRTALDVKNVSYTYNDLYKIAGGISNCIKKRSSSEDKLIGILADRSITAYSGILGILLSGKGYVPFNKNFPVLRTLSMIELSQVKTIIVGEECIEYLEECLKTISSDKCFLMPDKHNSAPLKKKYPRHQFIMLTSPVPGNEPIELPSVDGDSIAYLLFTSGSTGVPKGVAITNKNVSSFLNYLSTKYHFDKTDRFFQISELTFDLSVQDLFLCWMSGACLCVSNDTSTVTIAKFIKEKKITSWFSVPSVAVLLSKMRLLKSNTFPLLKYSMFCGEVLPERIAQEWQSAAPNSTLINFYGPTEGTISITHYEWKKDSETNHCLNGIVPIGTIFETQEFCILDELNKPVATGEKGELCIRGTQVISKYFSSVPNQNDIFIKIQGQGENTWYKTGDLVTSNQNNIIYYLGRKDSQVKIKGYRVELGEIDYVIRIAATTDMIATITQNNPDGTADKILSFVVRQKDSTISEADIIKECMIKLPKYMIPDKIFFLDGMPLNSNGKIDRQRLTNEFKYEG
ncbi:MAG: hypothetical protein EPN85_06315 [Bacteroidetes bacterium]|nr:MAG: hypothetical protein EPN85_06315 [Bacteroidota bacterium]